MTSAPLAGGIQRLQEGYARRRLEPTDEQVRDGLIQRFQFTYELCYRMLQRYLRDIVASLDDVDQMTFQDLIRTGSQQGLLNGDWAAWRRYPDLRARSSHTYYAEVAEHVVSAIPDFLTEARHLHDQLSRRLAQG